MWVFFKVLAGIQSEECIRYLSQSKLKKRKKEEIKGNKECKYVYIILNKGMIDKL